MEKMSHQMCGRSAFIAQAGISDQLGMQLSIIEGGFIKKILVVAPDTASHR